MKRLLISLHVMFLFVTFFMNTTIYVQAASTTKDIVPGQIIIKLRETQNLSFDKIQSMQNQFSFNIIDENSKHGYQLLQFSAYSNLNDIMEELKNNPYVEKVEFNHLIKADYVPNDCYYEFQWGLNVIKAANAWDIVKGNNSVKVAVLDTGVNSLHPDLFGKVIAGRNFVDDLDPLNTDDCHGHGTHVAGIIGATMENNVGIAGLASGVTILPVKVLDSEGIGNAWSVAKGIDYAVASGAKIINMSLGSYYGSGIIQDAVNNALQKGAVLVAAAGNEGISHVSYPAAYPGVLAVSALNALDNLAGFSNYGTQISLAAPGESILSTYGGPGADPDHPYKYLSGTSMAAPFVAGLAALILSEDPSLSGKTVRDTLCFSADDLGTVGKDSKYGYGRINAYKAVDYGKITVSCPKSMLEKGEKVNVSIIICDILGHVKTDASGFVNLKSSNPGLILPSVPVEIKNGVGEVEIQGERAGDYLISASDAGETAKWVEGVSPVLTVTAAQVVQGIQGKVLLEAKNLHGGISVKISNTDRAVFTNNDGFYEIHDLPEGTYDLEISYHSYLKKRVGPVNVSSGVVHTIPDLSLKAGDIDENNEVDLFDFVMMSHAYGTTVGDPRWNSCADIVVDSRIDLYDLFWIAKNYGEKGWE
jgi:thermitase